MTNVWRVARRELKGYFDHPTAYILIVAFLALGLFLAFRTLYATGMADLRAFFDYLPWLYAVFIPAITMRSLAEERGRGTLEWLMSQPLSEAELVLGKCLGDWLFALIALAGTLPTALGVLWISGADPGPVLAQYVGGALLAFQLVGLGLFASAATRNQITAFILAAVVALSLVLAGLQIVLVGLPPAAGAVATGLAIPPHFAGVSRGVVDLRDVLYFVTTGALFLVGAWFLVVRLRLSRERGAYRRLRIGVAALALGVVALNLLGGQIRGRLDLTEDDLYTLSPGTRQLLTGLDDVVTIRLFASDELPPEIGLTRRDVEDLLADFRRYSDGNLRVETVNPDESEDAATEARSYGIRQIQFNVLREDEFQVRNGWFGLAVSYAGEQEVIPYIARSDDLEYRLASAVASMTSDGLPTLAFATGFGALGPDQVPLLRQSLADRWEMTALELPAGSADGTGEAEGEAGAAEGVAGAEERDAGGAEGEDEPAPAPPVPSISPDSVDVLAVVKPTETVSPEAADSIASYLERGGSALLLLDRVLLQSEQGTTTGLETGLEPLLAERGVRLHADMVADHQSNQTISVGQQGAFSVVQGYPLWPILLPASNHPTTRGLERVAAAWASALEITDADLARPLLATSEAGDLVPPGRSVQPDALSDPDPSVLSRRLVAAVVDPGESRSGGRVIVMGDADLVLPQIARSSPQNLTFLANAVDWLGQDESLIAIRSKDRTPAPLVFDSDVQRIALRWGNLVGVPVAFILLGLGRSVGRRRDAERLREEIAA